MRIFLCSLLITWISLQTNAQQVAVSDSVVVNEILLECHQKTIDRIILREIALKKGNKILRSELQATLQREASKLFNTGLFSIVDIFPVQHSPETINIVVSLTEKWYFWPVPIIELADRNFNEWWRQRGRDLDRLNYGIRLVQQNFRGRNQDLKILMQLGFTKKLDFEYDIPYLNQKQTIGATFSAFYASNKNVAFNTLQHQLKFLKSDTTLLERFDVGFKIYKREHFYNTHSLGLQYNFNKIADTVAVLNPDYFLKGRTKQSFLDLNYTFNRDLRNMAAYPLTGMWLNVYMSHKFGLNGNPNISSFRVHYANFWQLSKKEAKTPLYFSTHFIGRVSNFRQQAYNMMRSFGYQYAFVRGYDMYVIEGQNLAILKNTLRWRVFSTRLDVGKLVDVQQFKTMPIALYLKTYTDAGFVNNNFTNAENTRLTNKLLAGGGAGLDLVFYNAVVMRFEYSLNREINTQGMPEKGFFFNLSADF